MCAPEYLQEPLRRGGASVHKVAMFMGHAITVATEHIGAHVFDTDAHVGVMAVFDAQDPTGAPAKHMMRTMAGC